MQSLQSKIMKANSPTHRMIQLRRRTEKIVIPKASWDLTNKQNSNMTNLYETSKSKNNSSKKSSLQKGFNLKKNSSMNNTMLKCTIKKIPKNQVIGKEAKQKSTEKRSSHKKSEIKINTSTINSNCFFQSMNKILSNAKDQPINKIYSQYQKCFTKFVPKNQNQKLLFNVLSKHMQFWVTRCQSLHHTVQQVCKQTPKLDILNVLKVESQNTNNYTEGNEQSLCSQSSMCSYLVDPQEEVKMKPIKKQLKDQLHLNFAKVDYLRKNQLE